MVEFSRVTMIGNKVLMQAKGKIWREVWKKITTVESYVRIFLQCEKDLIQSASLEENYTFETLDKRLEYLDAIIDLANTLEDDTLVELELPPRFECVFSFCMLKEKQVAMKAMQDEFDRVIKDINEFKTKWNYLGRFSVPSFWNEEIGKFPGRGSLIN